MSNGDVTLTEALDALAVLFDEYNTPATEAAEESLRGLSPAMRARAAHELRGKQAQVHRLVTRHARARDVLTRAGRL